ncbi:MAG: YggT family protein [Pyrinomonadaceae bacterium]
MLIARIYTILFYLIWAITGCVTLLLLLRVVINYANVNPFSRWVLAVRHWSDPFVEPVRRTIMGYGLSYKVAPIISILLTLLLGYVAVEFVSSVIVTVANTSRAFAIGNFVAAVGFILYGLLALYGALLIIRIIFSWGQVRSSNVWMRRLAVITDPILVPLRRVIPPLGMFDLSPLVAFLIIWILQQVVSATMLRGMPVG